METRLFLDSRQSKDGHSCPVKVALSVSHKTIYFSTGIKVEPQCWDKESQQVINHPKSKEWNRKLLLFQGRIEEILERVIYIKNVPVNDTTGIKKRVDEILHPEKAQKLLAENLVKARFLRYSSTRNADRTKETYLVTLKRMSEYMGPKIETLKFEDLTLDWFFGFEQFMKRTMARNSCVWHLKNIRAVVKYANDEGITNYNMTNRLSYKRDPTPHRDLMVENLRVLFDFPCDPQLEYHRDMYKLMFMLAGLSTTDLCHLKSVMNGRIVCNRQKSGEPVSLPVLPEIQEILNKHKGKEWLVSILDRVKDVNTYTKTINKALKRIGPWQWQGRENGHGAVKLHDPLFPKVTAYSSRHTWASIASRLDIPEDVISRAMGHKRNSILSIYINYSTKKVDEAIRKVIDWVLYGIIDGQQVVKPGTPEFYGEKADLIIPYLNK